MRRTFPFLSAVFAAALLLGGADGCSSDPDVEGAKLYVQQEDYAQALTRLDAALARDPDNAAALALKAEVYRLQSAELTDAAERRALLTQLAEAAGRVHTLEPDNTDIVRTRLGAWANEIQLGSGNLRAAQNDPARVAQAVGAFENAVMVLPDSAAGHYNLGLAYLVQGTPAQAIPALERAIELGLADENAYVYLSRSYLTADRGPDAVAVLERAQTAFPESQDIRAELLNAYAATGQSERALGAYDQAIAGDPDNALLRYNYGSTLLQAERYDEAIEQLRRATELDPSNSSAFYNLGAAYQNQAAGLQERMRDLDARDTATYDRLRAERDAFLEESIAPFESARRISTAAGESAVEVCRALFRAYTTLGRTAEATAAGECAGEDMN